MATLTELFKNLNILIQVFHDTEILEDSTRAECILQSMLKSSVWH